MGLTIPHMADAEMSLGAPERIHLVDVAIEMLDDLRVAMRSEDDGSMVGTDWRLDLSPPSILAYALAGSVLGSFMQAFVGRLGERLSDALLARIDSLREPKKPSEVNRVLDDLELAVYSIPPSNLNPGAVSLAVAEGSTKARVELKMSGLSEDDAQLVISRISALVYSLALKSERDDQRG